MASPSVYHRVTNTPSFPRTEGSSQDAVFSMLKPKMFQADRDELVTLEPELQVLSNSGEDKRALPLGSP